MTGMVWRCGHARTAENTASGRKPQCRCCKQASQHKCRGGKGDYIPKHEPNLTACEMAQGSDNLLRAICTHHLAIVAHFAAQGRNVRVLL